MPKINKLGVIGSPIDHSLSPFIHSRFARQANLNIDYRPYKVESDEIDMFLKDFFADKNAIGLNVTLPLKKEAFLQKPDIAHLKPRFEDWRLIKAQALVTGKLIIKDEKLKVEFRLWDLAAAKEMTALAFTTTPSNWRRVAHIISDKIYERLTGEEGYFDTRIIYVAESGPKNQRIKKLAIMDQDGFNTKYLTLGNELVLTPRFNPTNQMVTYLSYLKTYREYIC